MLTKRHEYILFLLACCMLVPQCAGRQEGMLKSIRFYLEEGMRLTKGEDARVLDPVAVFPAGERQDTLWVAAVSQEIKMGNSFTKGIPYGSTEGFPTDETLGLIAYQHFLPGADSTSWMLYTAENTSRTVRYIPDTGRWIPTPDLYLPNEERYMHFFAFGPQDESVRAVSAVDHAGPAITYRVPADVDNQRGFLVATPDEQYLYYPPTLRELSVPLSMQHVLTGIRFAVENVLKLVSVTLSGVYDQGVYYMCRDRWNTFTKSEETPTFGVSITDYEEDMVATGTMFERTAPYLTLMMIPQRLPAGATIAVRVEKPDHSILEYTIDVAGQLWEEGKEVTYIIARAPSPYIFNFTLTGDFPFTTEDVQ